MEERLNSGTGGERPLLTFLILSYNQERFIAEAVAGAFSQGYSPLEILLSDDCSSDRSFGIMEEMAQSYRGPHKIVLNRNPVNLGIGAHINRAMEIATGELVVVAAGDDVSMETRTERCFLEWTRRGRAPCSIYSDAILIDSAGTEIRRMYGGNVPSHARTVEEAVARESIGVAGCTHAWTKSCFDVFGPMDSRVVAEDMTIPFRSLLLGEVHYLDEPLIRYRMTGENTSGDFGLRPTWAMRAREARNHAAVYASWGRDIRVALEKGLLSADRAAPMLRELSRLGYWKEAESRYLESDPWKGLLALIGSLLKTGNVYRPTRIVARRIRTRNTGAPGAGRRGGPDDPPRP